ncbi:MAG: endonuclease/exonuclease/phosphatase family protein, partial [Coriobacteriia bacterium]|nr:endonuclease/exonuclease/phosphatase family protein [Coriobacteriia bacterium]
MKKLISWNVNGLRASLNKGFMEQFEALDADLFMLQEIKLQEGQVELELPGYYQSWSYALKKGYSGTAIFSKEKPLRVLRYVDSPQLAGDNPMIDDKAEEYVHLSDLDREGRVTACEFKDFWVVNV